MTLPNLQAYVFIPIVFLAVFTQSVSGFGSGLVAMAMLPGIIGLHIASPLVALMGASLEIILLKSFFLLNSTMVAASHAISGSLTPVVWQDYFFSLPAIALGLIAGLSLDRFLNPVVLRKIILMLLLLLALRMIL